MTAKIRSVGLVVEATGDTCMSPCIWEDRPLTAAPRRVRPASAGPLAFTMIERVQGSCVLAVRPQNGVDPQLHDAPTVQLRPSVSQNRARIPDFS